MFRVDASGAWGPVDSHGMRKPSANRLVALRGADCSPPCGMPHPFPRSAASGATRSTDACFQASPSHISQPLPPPRKASEMSRQGTSTVQLKRGPGRKRKYATDADRRRAYALARRVKDEKDGRVFLRPYEPREWRVKSPPRGNDATQCEQDRQIVWTPVHPNYVSPLLWRWRDPSDGGRAYLYDAMRGMVAVRPMQQ